MSLEVVYFSDVLCVWAYAGQVRVDELRRQFGERITVVERFVSVYGDVPGRIAEQVGGAEDAREAYARKKRAVAARFDHTSMHPDCFTRVVPKSSNQAHLVLCAVRSLIADGSLDAQDGGRVSRLVRAVRQAFFEQAKDVAQLEGLLGLMEAHEVPRAAIEAKLADGSAMAELSADLRMRDTLRLEGSPTYVLDGGREKLFGNVGYRIIEATVTELLGAGQGDRGASWC